MEKTEELWPGGCRYLWDEHLFRPGTDSFLLGAFPRLTKECRVADLGAGTGLLGLLLLAREPSVWVTGIELLPQACALAEKNAAINGLSERMTCRCGDLRAMPEVNCFDLVISNPPYFKTDSGYRAEETARRTARSEEMCTLPELCAAAARLLTYGGRFAVVYRPERLAELFAAMGSVRLEPKRLRFVLSRPEAAPSLVLVEGRLGGRPGLSVEPPLLLRQADGSTGPEMDAIYFRDRQEE